MTTLLISSAIATLVSAASLFGADATTTRARAKKPVAGKSRWLKPLAILAVVLTWIPLATAATAGTWTATAALSTPRRNHTATLLTNGKVLVAGGGVNVNGGILSLSEIFDPSTGTWAATGSLNTAREGHMAILLPNGKVLVAGGYDSGYLTSAELYDPVSGVWTVTGAMSNVHEGKMTLLPNGKVLVVGGRIGSTSLASAELYDPATGSWTSTGSMNSTRSSHTTTLLPNGKVLVTGGYNGDGSPTGFLARRSCMTRLQGRGQYHCYGNRPIQSHGDIAAQWQSPRCGWLQ